MPGCIARIRSGPGDSSRQTRKAGKDTGRDGACCSFSKLNDELTSRAAGILTPAQILWVFRKHRQPHMLSSSLPCWLLALGAARVGWCALRSAPRSGPTVLTLLAPSAVNPAVLSVRYAGRHIRANSDRARPKRFGRQPSSIARDPPLRTRESPLSSLSRAQKIKNIGRPL